MQFRILSLTIRCELGTMEFEKPKPHIDLLRNYLRPQDGIVLTLLISPSPEPVKLR